MKQKGKARSNTREQDVIAVQTDTNLVRCQ
jgi:hypothetical protein